MRLRSLETFKINLPFRFSFGHSLATRSDSWNLIVRITLSDGTVGYGEGVPRDYVTGENVETAENAILRSYAPEFFGQNIDFQRPELILENLSECFSSLKLEEKKQGASWCAFELAVLDSCMKANSMKPYDLMPGLKQENIRYGGVVPFAKSKALKAILYFYKFYGFETVKLKLGNDLDTNISILKLARNILGQEKIIRVDANCAWNFEQAKRFIETFRPYNIASYEQPLPANDLDDLAKLTKEFEEPIVVDESLCTINDAKLLISSKACKAFNLRISKIGGYIASNKLYELAVTNNIALHLGAQVGESGILSSVARFFACGHYPMENYEGSANMFLLRRDICRENLNCGLGGYANLNFAKNKFGFGVSILENRINSMLAPPEESSVVAEESCASEECRKNNSAKIVTAECESKR